MPLERSEVVRAVIVRTPKDVLKFLHRTAGVPDIVIIVDQMEIERNNSRGGLLFFLASVILAQIFLVLKKKQFEKVQLANRKPK